MKFNLPVINAYVRGMPNVFYVAAALSVLVSFTTVIILEWSHVIYILSMITKALGLELSFTDMAMLMPESTTYFTFAVENITIPLCFVSTAVALWAGIGRFSNKIMVSYTVAAAGLIFMAFYFTPYFFLTTQHYTAKFIPVAEFKKSDFKQQRVGTADSAKNRAMVLEINGDARAYPISYITQAHVAGGEEIGGENVVMTFCGLSHLSVPYMNEVNGKNLNLRVLGQFHNNLVLFDEDTHEPIHQVKGRLEFSKSPLTELPSVMMDLDNFVELYPNGKVYYRAPEDRSMFDHAVFWLMNYAMGEQYDESTDELAFDTSPYDDKRLGAKELIYAIVKHGQPIVFTKEFIAEKSNGYFEVEVEGKTIAVKYFPDSDYIDMFVGGNAQEVNHLGILPDGTKLEKYRHISQMIWRVYQYFYPGSKIYS